MKRNKVAIVSTFEYHTECIGFLLDIFKNNFIVHLYCNDKMGYIKYFRKLYEFQRMSYSKKFNIQDYIRVIVLSHNDPYLNTIKRKNISNYLFSNILTEIRPLKLLN